jgi:YVTN family beta-propeller protein
VVDDTGKGEVFVADHGTDQISVLNTTNRVIATVSGGSNPNGGTYDGADGEVFITNYGGGSVTVINDTTNGVVTTVPVGLAPHDVAYDGAREEAFVVNFDSDNVTVINTTTNSVTANFDVGMDPANVVYDSGQNEIFVSNYGSNAVSVINDSTNGIAATVHVGSGPQGMAYDGKMGEVFVDNSNSNNISVIDDTTNKVVANIPAGNDPCGNTYDPVTGQVLVANYGTDNVSVISDATNAVAYSVDVGAQPAFPGYIAQSGYVFLSNEGQGTLSILSESGTLLTTIPVGTNPEGISYDNSNGDIYVADHNSDTVSVISPTTNTVAFTIGPSAQGESTYGPYGMELDNATKNMYVGNEKGTNTASIVAGPLNGTAGIDIGGTDPDGLTYDPDNGYIYISDQLSDAVGVLNGTTNQLVNGFVNPIPAQDYPGRSTYDHSNHEIYVVDMWSNNVTVISGSTNTVVTTIPVGVNPVNAAFDPLNGDIYVSNRGSNNVTVISGSTNQVIANIGDILGAGGIAYSSFNGYVYVGNEKGVNALTVINGTTIIGTIGLSPGVSPNTIAVDPLSDELYVTENVSNSVSVVLPTTQIIVPSPTASHNPVDVGQSVTFTVSPIGGSGTYTTYAWSGLPPGCPASNSKTIICAPTKSTGSPFSISVKVTDSDSDAATSSSLSLTVDTGMVVPVPTASHDPADVGQPVTIATVPTGGSGSYTTYAWTGLPTGCSSANTYSISCTPTTTSGSPWTIKVAVTDSNGNTTTSPALPFTVDSGPSLTAIAESSPAPCSAACSADQGQTLSVNTTASGGSGVYTFDWAVIAGSSYCLGTASGTPTSTYTCSVGTVSSAQTWTITVNVTDSNGCKYPSPCSGSVLTFTVTLHPDPSLTAVVQTSPVSCSSTCSATQGQNLSVSTTAGAGSGGYKFTWAIMDGSSYCSGSAWGTLTSTYSCTVGTVSTPQSWTVTVYVADSAGCRYPSPCGGGALWFNVTLDPASSPTLSALTVSPTSSTVPLEGTTSPFTATPSCTSTCPTEGIGYAWTLNKTTMGTVNSPYASSTTFTAGSKAGVVVLTVNATLDGSEKSASVTIAISSTTVATVSSVVVSPKEDSLETGGMASFTATVTCDVGTCPAGVTYLWSLNNTLGSLNSDTGQSTTFRAGSKAGIVTLTVDATLNNVTKSDSASISVNSSSVATLFSVGVTPLTISLLVGGAAIFVATPTCSGSVCPVGIVYAWSSNNSLGVLNSSNGQSVTFTAGNRSGSETLYVNASLNGVTARSTATITITALVITNPPPPVQNAWSWWWLLVVAAVAITVALCVFIVWWSRREEDNIQNAGPLGGGAAPGNLGPPEPLAPVPPRAPVIKREEWREGNEPVSPNPPRRP